MSLRDYINDSFTIEVNSRLKIRLSEELASNYRDGLYDKYLEHINRSIEVIDTLDIRYPGGAKPIYYLYIVPLKDADLLDIPSNFRGSNGGAKPVSSFDLDGFNSAYGLTENICLREEFGMQAEINTIHELIHLVNSMFFNKDRYINEGIAEAVPYYALDYENKWDPHRNVLTSLKEEEIKSIKELIKEGRDGSYGNTGVEGKPGCTFRYSYISSYLACASILDHIKEKYMIEKKDTPQILFETLRSNKNYCEDLVKELSDALGMDYDTLYEKKDIQIEYIKKLKR